MAGKYWNLEWLNHNAQRHYPLADDATGIDQTGGFTLPNDFIVELDLPVHAGMDVDPARFFIQQIATFATGFSVLVGYQTFVGSAVPVATALIARNGFVRNQSFALGGVTPFDDTSGKIVIGKFDEIDLQTPGLFTFDFAATRLDPDAIRPMIRGVSALVLINQDGSRSAPIYGDVELVAGNNIQLVPIIVAGQDPQIRINAIQGAGLSADCVCLGDQTTEPIMSIDGVAGTPGGDFSLVGNECIQFQPISGGLRVVDVCAKPCCGCPELEKVTQDLERLKIEAATVQAFASSLQTSVETMDMIVLGARLGDRNCVTCA